MKTTTKKLTTAILLFLITLCMLVGIWAVKPLSASAYTADTFAMNKGAEVRISDRNGIRFTATLGENVYDECFDEQGNAKEGKTLGMLVVPAYYYVEYAQYCEENVDYATNGAKYYEFFSEVKGKIKSVTYSADKVMENENGTYSIRLALVDVLFNNTNLEYCAVAYIATQTGETVSYEYADFTLEDNARSMSYVAAIATEYGTSGLETYEENSIYRSVGISFDSQAGQFVYNGTKYDLLSEAFEATGETMETASEKYGKAYIIGENNPYVDVEFLGKTVFASDLTKANGNKAVPTFAYTNDSRYVDTENGNTSAIIVTNNSGEINDPNLNFGALLPETDPGYDWYEVRFWSHKDFTRANNAGGVIFGSSHVSVKAGWNTIKRTWAELTGYNGLIYPEEICDKNTVVFAFGDITGKNYESDVTFLGKQVTPEEFTALNVDKPVTFTLTRDSQYVDTANGNTTAILVQGGATNYPEFNFGALLPATDPGYDYYEVRLWTSRAFNNQLLFGSHHISTVVGWNTIKYSWAELTGNNGLLYTDAMIGHYEFCYAFGNITGKYVESDVTFLGEQVTVEALTALNQANSYANVTFSLTNDPQYVDTERGNETAILVTGTAGDSNVYYGLWEDVDPGYAYYEIRIWSRADAPLYPFAGANRDVKQGWNTIICTWAELNYNNGNPLIYTYTLPGGTVWFAFGNITGLDEVSDVTVLGTAMNVKNLKKGENAGQGTVSVTSNPTYLDTGCKVGVIVSNFNTINLQYTGILPQESALEGYDYFVWRIYSTHDIAQESHNFWLGGTPQSFKAGWNDIILPASALKGTPNIYGEGLGGITLAFGSITGHYNAN